MHQMQAYLSHGDALRANQQLLKDAWESTSEAYEQSRRVLSEPNSIQVLPFLIVMFASAGIRQDRNKLNQIQGLVWQIISKEADKDVSSVKQYIPFAFNVTIRCGLKEDPKVMEQRFKLCSKAVMKDLETNFNAEECCMIWVNYIEYLCASG